VNRERRERRRERPELLHDHASKLLEAQATLLHGSVEKFAAQAEEAAQFTGRLQRMTVRVCES
jgi:hypothetical protein